MGQSEEIGELAKALCNAQREIGGATKSTTNPFFKSTYATLKDVWEAIREPLTKNGLSIVQFCEENVIDSKPSLCTTLLHTSGQWISGSLPLNPEKNTPQAMGSAMSYNRRYGLAAMVGVYQEDDDGNAATKQTKRQAPAGGNSNRHDLYTEATTAFTEWAKSPDAFTPDEMAEIHRCWGWQDKLIEMYAGYKMKFQKAGSSRKPDLGGN